MFYHKQLVEGFLCDSHHCQVTLVGKSESYNELFKKSDATKFCRAFTSRNARKLDFLNDEQVECDDDDDEESVNSCKQFKKTFFWESSNKSLSSAVWTLLCIEEAKEINILNDSFFGPKMQGLERISFKQSRDAFMKAVNDER